MKKMGKIISLFFVATFSGFFLLPPVVTAADVNVYGVGAFADGNLNISVFADISEVDLKSFGVKLSYNPSELTFLTAQKNEDVWHLGNYPYDFYEGGTGSEVILLGGILDPAAPLSGISGTNVLLGTIIFSPAPGFSSAPSLSLSLGKSGKYNNFVATDASLLDGSVVFGTVTVPQNTDADGDGFSDDEENTAGSDPANPSSRPGSPQLLLRKGYNQISFPAEIKSYENLYNLMESLGGASVISKVLVFDQTSQTFSEAGYDAEDVFYGNNPSFASGGGLPGLIIYAKQGPAPFSFTTEYCHTWNLLTGTNLTGTPCLTSPLLASQLLELLGGEAYVSGIQQFDTSTGTFKTLGYENGALVGVDFSLNEYEGYLIHMKTDKLNFRPDL